MGPAFQTCCPCLQKLVLVTCGLPAIVHQSRAHYSLSLCRSRACSAKTEHLLSHSLTRLELVYGCWRLPALRGLAGIMTSYRRALECVRDYHCTCIHQCVVSWL